MSDTPPPMAPICAYDIASDGAARPADWLAPLPAAGYRWLHCDLSDPGLPVWLADHLPEIAAAALLQPETRPRTLQSDDGVILNMRGVNLNPGALSDDMVSVRIWAQPGLVVTVRMRRVFAIDDLRQRAEANRAPPGIDAFLADLAQGLVERIETVSLDLDDRCDDLEELVYDDAMPFDPAEIAALRRQSIKLRRYVAPQVEALNQLVLLDTPLLAKRSRRGLSETTNRARRTLEELISVHDRLAALSDHIDSHTSARMARHSFVFSAIAAVFLPLGFVTGLFGVNVAGIPGTANPAAFWWLSGALAVLGLALYAFLRWRRMI